MSHTSLQKFVTHAELEHYGQKVAASVVSSNVDRVVGAFVFAWWSRYQSQIINPAKRGQTFFLVLVVMFVLGYAQKALNSLDGTKHALMHQWLQNLFSAAGMLNAFIFASVLLSFYDDSLTSSLDWESFRSFSVLFILISLGTIISYAVDNQYVRLKAAAAKKQD